MVQQIWVRLSPVDILMGTVLTLIDSSYSAKVVIGDCDIAQARDVVDRMRRAGGYVSGAFRQVRLFTWL